jgi:ABC-type nitrate/sulfonate/bicarbonate transport system substrate-binding protein
VVFRLLKENPALVRRAMKAFRRSCQAIRKNPEEAAAFGAQVCHLKWETFQRALLRGLGTWELDAKLDLEGMGNCLNIQAETGAIPPTLALSSMVQSL